MQFSYRYRITYETGQIYECPPTKSVYIDVTQGEYKLIVKALINDTLLAEMEGLTELRERMREDIEFADRFYNMDGSKRTVPLKKPRKFIKAEFFPLESEIERLKKMKDPIAALERPKEQMKIYRQDGSYVMISS